MHQDAKSNLRLFVPFRKFQCERDGEGHVSRRKDQGQVVKFSCGTGIVVESHKEGSLTCEEFMSRVELRYPAIEHCCVLRTYYCPPPDRKVCNTIESIRACVNLFALRAKTRGLKHGAYGTRKMVGYCDYEMWVNSEWSRAICISILCQGRNGYTLRRVEIDAS